MPAMAEAVRPRRSPRSCIATPGVKAQCRRNGASVYQDKALWYHCIIVENGNLNRPQMGVGYCASPCANQNKSVT